MQCFKIYGAVFIHLLMLLSVGPYILIHITTNILLCDAVWKESFRVSHPASADICCDVLTHCIHGFLCVWLEIIYLPSLCWERSSVGLRNGVERNSISILLWVTNHCLIMVMERWKLTLSRTTYFGKSSPVWALSCAEMRSLQRRAKKVTRCSLLYEGKAAFIWDQFTSSRQI